MRFVVAVALVAVSSALPAPAAQPRSFPMDGDPLPHTVATDQTYGTSPSNPIRVGGVTRGLEAGEAYLASLRGPNGEPVTFVRRTACCAFRTANAWFGDEALLEAYEVRLPGRKKPVVLYLNTYEWDDPRAPAGFTVPPGQAVQSAQAGPSPRP